MKHRQFRLGTSMAVAGLCILPFTAFAAQGDWIVRGGAGLVDPDSDSLTTSFGELEADSATGLTGEVTYMFADHWGVELLATSAFSHDISVKSGGSETDIASFSEVLPTLSLQYHFNPEGTLRPYIGAGLNYTMFFDEELNGQVPNASLSLDNGFGLAGQIGLDWGLGENWFVNAAVRYIDVETSTKLTSATDPSLNYGDLGDADFNPWVYQLQIGYRFRTAAPAVAATAAAAAAAPAVAAEPPPPPPPPPPPADSDGDGVVDASDQCPDTPKGDRVGSHGCSCEGSRQVQFAVDSADLTDEGRATLDEAADTLKRMKFEAGTVIGHTDNSGAEEYNQKLSERRAETVARYLESKGIAVGRLTFSGAGETQPIADNATKEGRAQNRRVVLKRTDCDAPR